MTSCPKAQAPYARVKQYLLDGLASGLWPPGSLMPSEAELVAAFGVSRMTVGRALRELQSGGLVQRVQGLGTYAGTVQQVSSTLQVRDLQAEIEARGHRHSARLLLQQAEAAAPALAAQLGLAPGSTVFHTLLLHLEDQTPLQCEDRYVNPAAAPGYLAADFSRTTPTQWLLQHAQLWRVQYRIEAARASRQEAELLQIAADEPCLVMLRRTFSRGGGQEVPVTLARLVHPGRRYALQGDYAP
jgi:GntR family histidine utilization transcriptional repressor